MSSPGRAPTLLEYSAYLTFARASVYHIRPPRCHLHRPSLRSLSFRHNGLEHSASIQQALLNDTTVLHGLLTASYRSARRVRFQLLQIEPLFRVSSTTSQFHAKRVSAYRPHTLPNMSRMASFLSAPSPLLRKETKLRTTFRCLLGTQRIMMNGGQRPTFLKALVLQRHACPKSAVRAIFQSSN